MFRSFSPFRASAQAGEPKNIILTRAREVAPPEGVAGRPEKDVRKVAADAFARAAYTLREPGANWGNLLGGTGGKFYDGGEESEERFLTSLGMTNLWRWSGEIAALNDERTAWESRIFVRDEFAAQKAER
jgi:hypothetical protein